VVMRHYHHSPSPLFVQQGLNPHFHIWNIIINKIPANVVKPTGTGTVPVPGIFKSNDGNTPWLRQTASYRNATREASQHPCSSRSTWRVKESLSSGRQMWNSVCSLGTRPCRLWRPIIKSLLRVQPTRELNRRQQWSLPSCQTSATHCQRSWYSIHHRSQGQIQGSHLSLVITTHSVDNNKKGTKFTLQANK
jgi:hypothetical protein